jgi:hypothetical protein
MLKTNLGRTLAVGALAGFGAAAGSSCALVGGFDLGDYTQAADGAGAVDGMSADLDRSSLTHGRRHVPAAARLGRR